MAYVEWHGNLPQHHKTAWLMACLKIGKAQAVGTRGCLYAWAIENRPGGIIERSLLWFACAWEGDKDALVQALIDSKLVDAIDKHTVKLHDWDDYTRGYRKARADAERRTRERSEEAARQSRDGSARAAQSPPRSDLSGTDLSGSEQNGEEHCAEPPSNGVSAPALASQLVDIWNDGKDKALHIRVTPKRIEKTRARLKDFSPDQIKAAVLKLKDSKFHNGDNDRGWRAPGPEWVLNTTERVEQFLNKQDMAPATGRWWE